MSEQHTIYKIGTCPHCGSDNLTYSDEHFNDGNTLVYPFVCDDCGKKGSEIYNVSYSKTVSDEEDEESIVEGRA